MRGTGFALNYVGLVVSIYFIPIIAWGMVFFQKSFESPLPWSSNATGPYAGDTPNYFMYEVVNAVDRDESGSWVDYPGTALDGRLVGWNAFLFFLVWLCMFKGTGWTGRVVYFTMGMPLIVIVILIGRGASLPNAGRGIKMYFATWRSEALSQTKIWQDAVGQVFYSTGVGFGFYTAYARTTIITPTQHRTQSCSPVQTPSWKPALPSPHSGSWASWISGLIQRIQWEATAWAS